MSCSGPRSTCCAGRSPSPPASAATRRHCSWPRPAGSRTSMPSWPARPTWTPGAQRFSPEAWPRPAACSTSRGRPAPRPRPVRPPRPSDLLLDGLATLITDGRAAAADALRQATSAFAVNQVSAEDNFRWGWLTTVPANVLWDEDSWHEINARQLRFAREAGALARLPIDLTASAVLMVWRGELLPRGRRHRRGRGGHRGDRDPDRAVRRHAARGLPRPGERGGPAHRGRHHSRHRRRSGHRRAVRRVGGRHPGQRARSL